MYKILIAEVRNLDLVVSMQTPSQPGSEIKLPDIALSELPEATKDFLIACSATGKSVPEVILEVLDEAATRHGFEPHKAA
jgi:hypothetical protein